MPHAFPFHPIFHALFALAFDARWILFSFFRSLDSAAQRKCNIVTTDLCNINWFVLKNTYFSITCECGKWKRIWNYKGKNQLSKIISFYQSKPSMHFPFFFYLNLILSQFNHANSREPAARKFLYCSRIRLYENFHLTFLLCIIFFLYFIIFFRCVRLN